MDEAGELDVGDVTARAGDAFKIPDCFCSEMVEIDLVLGVIYRLPSKKGLFLTLMDRSRRGSRPKIF